MEWWGCGLIVMPSFRALIVVSSSHIVVVLSSCIVVACGCHVQYTAMNDNHCHRSSFGGCHVVASCVVVVFQR